jgi:hypothetical protein
MWGVVLTACEAFFSFLLAPPFCYLQQEERKERRQLKHYQQESGKDVVLCMIWLHGSICFWGAPERKLVKSMQPNQKRR